MEIIEYNAITKIKSKKTFVIGIARTTYGCLDNHKKMFLTYIGGKIEQIEYDFIKWNEMVAGLKKLKDGEFMKLTHEIDFDEHDKKLKEIVYVYRGEKQKSFDHDNEMVEHVETTYTNDILTKKQYLKCCTPIEEPVLLTFHYVDGKISEFSGREMDENGRGIFTITFHNNGIMKYINTSTIFPCWVRFDEHGEFIFDQDKGDDDEFFGIGSS